MEKVLVKTGVYSFVLLFFFIITVYPKQSSYIGTFYEVLRYSGMATLIILVIVYLFINTEKENS